MKLQFVDLSEKMLLLLPPDRKNFYEISKQPATRKSNWPIFSSLSNSNAAGKAKGFKHVQLIQEQLPVTSGKEPNTIDHHGNGLPRLRLLQHGMEHYQCFMQRRHH
jgi:hypothetical protein